MDLWLGYSPPEDTDEAEEAWHACPDRAGEQNRSPGGVLPYSGMIHRIQIKAAHGAIHSAAQEVETVVAVRRVPASHLPGSIAPVGVPVAPECSASASPPPSGSEAKWIEARVLPHGLFTRPFDPTSKERVASHVDPCGPDVIQQDRDQHTQQHADQRRGGDHGNRTGT